jgi:serine/threonine protein kinase
MAPIPLEPIKAALAGRYAVERELGQGGMAVVLLARDERHGRPVALKLLRPELAAHLGTDRFLREIEIAARLAHPNILPLLDSGIVRLEDGHETPYYVMPLVEGESLRDRLTHGPLQAEEAIRLLAEVADALDCAHRQGIVHRDIKPDNILLQQGHAVVSDFGIARAVSAATGVVRLTETGMSLGTRGYMSPEQLAGLEVDHRSDIYSLGCLMVEMLTGRLPGPGGADLPPPLSPAIRAAVARALTPVPADRWDSAGAFAIALSAPAVAPRRRPVLLASVALILAIFVIARLAGLGPASARRRTAEVDSIVRRANALVSDRTVTHHNEAIAELRRVLQQDSTEARAWAVLARAYASADRWGFPIAGTPPESLGPTALRYTERALGLDSLSSDVWVARAWVDEYLDPARKVVALGSYQRAIALDSTSAEAWSRVGFLLFERAQLEEGLAAHRRAFTLDRRRYSFEVPIYFLFTRQLDSAARWIDTALAIAPNVYWTRVTAGDIAFELHDWNAAEAQFSAAERLETGAEIAGLSGLASVAAARGERARALEFLARAVGKTDSARPPTHNAIFLAEAFAQLSQRNEALSWLERYEPVGDLHFQLHLKHEPMLDPLRGEPRFKRLLRPLPP